MRTRRSARSSRQRMRTRAWLVVTVEVVVVGGGGCGERAVSEEACEGWRREAGMICKKEEEETSC